MSRETILFCFAGPTASGKSTICQELLRRDDKLRLSVSTTTRAPRSGEVDGEHYYFVSEEEFDKRISEDRFLEYASFGGKRYGTERLNVEQAVMGGYDLLLDIEIQGVSQVQRLYPERLVTSFVMPPSFAVLEERLRKRRTESEDKIQVRLETARREVKVLSQPDFARYLLINDELEKVVAQAQAILTAERISLARQDPADLADLIRTND